jgi:hypothetical protein
MSLVDWPIMARALSVLIVAVLCIIGVILGSATIGIISFSVLLGCLIGWLIWLFKKCRSESGYGLNAEPSDAEVNEEALMGVEALIDQPARKRLRLLRRRREAQR